MAAGREMMVKLNTPRRIFLVDDEPVILSSLKLILRREGFDVACFSDPRAALEEVRTAAPDLLITEVAMAHLSGINLAIEMLRTCPDCKVIFFSGQPSTTQLLEEAKVNGYNFDAIAKPVHPKYLIVKIRSLLGVT